MLSPELIPYRSAYHTNRTISRNARFINDANHYRELSDNDSHPKNRETYARIAEHYEVLSERVSYGYRIAITCIA